MKKLALTTLLASVAAGVALAAPIVRKTSISEIRSNPIHKQKVDFMGVVLEHQGKNRLAVAEGPHTVTVVLPSSRLSEVEDGETVRIVGNVDIDLWGVWRFGVARIQASALQKADGTVISALDE